MDENIRRRRFNLNNLYALDAILDARTLTEAGRQVRLSQPAMSVALRKLRDQFKDPLVVHIGGEQRLTVLAEALRPKVRRLLCEFDNTFRLRVEFDPATAIRRFTIAAPEALEIMLLGLTIPRLLRDAPGVQVSVLPLRRDTRLQPFDQGADMIVLPERFAVSGLEHRRLMSETPSCMVANDHPDVGYEMSVDAYLRARHVAVLDPLWPSTHLGATGRDLLSQRNIAVRTGLHAALPGLVLGTGLVATASGWLLQHFASMLPLKVVPFPVATEAEPIIAQWPAYLNDDPAHAWLLQQLVTTTRHYPS